MNFCTKCASYYTQPGTCNCYASVAPWTPWVYPVYPTLPVYPTVPTYPWKYWDTTTNIPSVTTWGSSDPETGSSTTYVRQDEDGRWFGANGDELQVSTTDS